MCKWVFRSYFMSTVLIDRCKKLIDSVLYKWFDNNIDNKNTKKVKLPVRLQHWIRLEEKCISLMIPVCLCYLPKKLFVRGGADINTVTNKLGRMNMHLCAHVQNLPVRVFIQFSVCFRFVCLIIPVQPVFSYKGQSRPGCWSLAGTECTGLAWRKASAAQTERVMTVLYLCY